LRIRQGLNRGAVQREQHHFDPQTVGAITVFANIGAVVGGYVVDTYGATGPLTLTAVLAASTGVLALLQPRG